MYNLTTKLTLTLLTLYCLFFSHQLAKAQCHIDDWTALKALYEEPIEDYKWNANWDYTFKNEEPPLDCTLDNLSYIRLDENGRVNLVSITNQLFISRIPEELEKLSELTHLIISNTGLYGNIPSELGNLSKLVELDLGSTNIVGNIPLELFNLTKLVKLNLGGTSIDGNIPPELGNLKNLVDLKIGSKNLSGNIPPELGNLENLVNLEIGGNVSGSIPPELGKLSNLAYLSLRYNNIDGNIPAALGNLTNLINLDLGDNELGGSIPPELGNLSKLEKLNLEDNQIISSIPPELGNLNNLVTLNLYKNQISGRIPPSLGKLSKLDALYLASNELSGEIPPELSNLTGLRFLWLQNNRLTGVIPDKFSNLNLDEFIVSNNKLTGIIPYMKTIYNDYYTNIFIFRFKYNYFICNDFVNNNDLIGLGSSPQNYNHNATQSFLVSSSEESITLSAPFSIYENSTYQWYKGNTQIKGATDTILYFNNVQFEDVGNYSLHIFNADCKHNGNDYWGALEGLEYISSPITVRRTDLEGCTDEYSCNYNQFAMIDDGSCEYIWCDTLTNPIKIKTTNEQILSEHKITFDLVIDSLGQNYSADGLTFTLDTRGNYKIESVEVISPDLLITEVDVSQLYENTLSIDRSKSELLASNSPLLKVTALIIIEDIPTDEETCSHFHISGGTELSSGHFISFDNVYIDIPFSNCFPYGGYGAEGKNWLPLVSTISPQNCKTNTNSLVEIKILEEGQSPFSYILKDENDSAVLQDTSNENLFIIRGLNAGKYKLTVTDANGKTTTLNTCIPLIASLNGNDPCNSSCVDYVTVPNGLIKGNHQAKKEIEIKGYVGKNETVEFSICD